VSRPAAIDESEMPDQAADTVVCKIAPGSWSGDARWIAGSRWPPRKFVCDAALVGMNEEEAQRRLEAPGSNAG